MNYHEFPSKQPNEEHMNTLAATAIVQYYCLGKVGAGRTDDIFTITRSRKRGQTVLHIPCGYFQYVRLLLFRQFALALLLHHHHTLDIQPYKVWAALAQNFLHVNTLWEKCLAELDRLRTIDTRTISTILDKYLVMEVIVEHHEPVYLSQYHQHRMAVSPSISQTILEELSKSQQSISHQINF